MENLAKMTNLKLLPSMMTSKKLFLKAAAIGVLSASFMSEGLAFHGYKPVNTGQQQPSPFLLNISDNAETAAQAFVVKLGEDGISVLSDSNLTQEQKNKAFQEILSESFAMKTIARFALGSYWRSANKKQQEEYLELFEDMITNVYINRFEEYNGEMFETDNARPQGKSDFVVTSFITSTNGPDVKVDWRVREKNGKYRIVDVIVEGVSMALTQRSDFAAVIQSGGGDVEALLVHLREKSNSNSEI